MIVVEFPAPDAHLCSFTVLGEPMSKARARVVNGHAFTPERTRVAEAQVQAAFLSSPDRYTPKTEAGYCVAAIFHAATRQRRDVDNMLKLLLDALNGMAWTDDMQVVQVHGRKSLVPKGEARTEVSIYSAPPLLGMQASCEVCGSMFRIYPSLRGRFCSDGCRLASKVANRKTRPCATCGVPIPLARKFCSLHCHKRGGRVVQQCAECGADVERFKSWSHNGRPFCDSTCRQNYWRAHRAIAARGQCSTCGGSTSKKSYVQCRACLLSKPLSRNSNLAAKTVRIEVRPR